MATNQDPNAVSQSAAEAQHRPKRRRLVHACNNCRSRKVKCDEREPACTNCMKSGIDCVTVNLRQPGTVATRREAQKPPETGRLPTDATAQVVHPAQRVNGAPQAGHEFAITQHQPFQTTPSNMSTEIQAGLSMSPEGRLPVLPRFTEGNSIHVMTQWLDLAFARIGVAQRFTTSRVTAQNLLQPLYFATPPSVPGDFDVDGYIEVFSSSLHLVYPIFDLDFLRRLMRDRLQSQLGNHSTKNNTSSDALFYLVIAIVCASEPQRTTARVGQYLKFVMSFLGTLIVEASLRSAQALFLLSVALRGYDQIEVAWHVSTLAASMAQSLGMHRLFSASYRAEIGEDVAEEQTRTWWAIFSINKALCIEIERPSSIRDDECNQALPHDVFANDPSPGYNLFAHVISLARVQSRVSEECGRLRSLEETESQDVTKSVKEKILTAGELDQRLQAWSDSLPSELRPADYRFCEPRLSHYVSFLAIQFNQMLVLLTRNTFIINLQIVQKEVDLYCAGKPFYRRLRNGQLICGDAARSIIHILDHLCETVGWSILNTIYAPMLSTYALAVRIIKHPSSRVSKADLQLLDSAIQFVEKQRDFTEDPTPKLSRMLHTLREQVSLRVETSVGVPTTPSTTRQISTEQSSTREQRAAEPVSNTLGTLSHTVQTRTVSSDEAHSEPLENSHSVETANEPQGQGSIIIPVSDNQPVVPFPGFADSGLWCWDDSMQDWDAFAFVLDLPA